MIKVGTHVVVTDNSGAKLLQCVGVLYKKYPEANIGDMIVGVVKVISSNKSRVKVSDIVKALVIREKRVLRYKDGSIFKFKDNAVILLDNSKNMVGNRIFGSVPRFFKEQNFIKLSSLVTEFI